MSDVVVVLLVLLPALLTYFLRSNGALVFMSVCAGYVAASLAGNELAGSLSGSSFSLRNTDLDLLFMFLPLAFTIFLTTGAVAGKSRVLMHAIAAGLAGALLVVAGAFFLNISLHLSLEGTTVWPQLRRAESIIAGGGALYSLLLIWFFSHHRGKKHH
jgi:hypothetical protein